MGCWNGTCGLTNLPIKRGDKIVLFPIVHNEHGRTGSGGFNYPGDIYTFISLPLYGTYDEGGGIDNITKNGKAVYDHFMGGTLQRIIRVNEEGMAHRFETLDKKPENIDELINDYIERGMYKNIGIMMVLESVFNDVKNALENHRIKYTEQGREFIEKHRAWVNNKEEGDYLFDNYQLWGDDYRSYRKNYFASFWGDSSESRTTYPFKHEFLYKLHKFEDDQILDSMVDLMLMEDILFSTRKFWTIQNGAGSQAEEYALLLVLADSVRSAADKKVKHMVKEWGYTHEEAVNRVFKV